MLWRCLSGRGDLKAEIRAFTWVNSVKFSLIIMYDNIVSETENHFFFAVSYFEEIALHEGK